MEISNIALENFRNISELVISPHPEVNVIYGENAQGKTNIIESIWMFTGAKSFRGAKDKEMVRFGSACAKATTSFICSTRPQLASVDIFEDGKKRIYLNEIELESASKLAGRFYSVVFSPAHLSLVREGPVFRRKFLDIAISQIVPKYDFYLKEYAKILAQRNALLKDLVRYPELMQTADIWEEHLARVAAAIIIYRARYVKKLAPIAASVYSGISGGRENLEISYRASGLAEYLNPAESTKEICKTALLNALKFARKQDMERGSTSVGPHRDDLEFIVNNVSLKLYGSQGQQRSCVLALKMAECGMIEEATGETPIILLDDVMSELDASRREYLLNHIEGRQVFVTCCDDQSFITMKKGKTFHINAGQIINS